MRYGASKGGREGGRWRSTLIKNQIWHKLTIADKYKILAPPHEDNHVTLVPLGAVCQPPPPPTPHPFQLIATPPDIHHALHVQLCNQHDHGMYSHSKVNCTETRYSKQVCTFLPETMHGMHQLTQQTLIFIHCVGNETYSNADHTRMKCKEFFL